MATFSTEQQVLAFIKELVLPRVVAAVSEGVFDFEAVVEHVKITFDKVLVESLQDPNMFGARLRIITDFKVVPNNGEDV